MRNLPPLIESCRRCGRRVLATRCDYQDGLPDTVHLDPTRLNQQAVIACVITGIPLWQVYSTAEGLATSMRHQAWPSRIDPATGDVVAPHKCDRHWDGTDITPRPTGTTRTTPDICPF